MGAGGSGGGGGLASAERRPVGSLEPQDTKVYAHPGPVFERDTEARWVSVWPQWPPHPGFFKLGVQSDISVLPPQP